MDSVRKLIKRSVPVVGNAPSRITQKPALRNMEKDYEKLQREVETLYSSLNIPAEFPQLKGVNFEYLHNLLAARNLKTIIRKKAIGSFFEWDKLHQAVGGRQQPLGNIEIDDLHWIKIAKIFICRHKSCPTNSARHDKKKPRSAYFNK